MNNKIETLIKTFFEKLEVKIDSIEIEITDEDIINVKISSEESGLLIGPHGRNLDTIQSILRLIISRQEQTKAKLYLEVNDYIESKDQKLLSFIQSKINFVENTGKEVILPFYSAYDRKKIHSFVSDHANPHIETKSVGEGKERRLHICNTGTISETKPEKKEKKLSIDIDGDDI